MEAQKGFGLIGILITLVIILGIIGTTYFSLQNIGTVQTSEGEGENINSIIQKAEDAKQKLENRSDSIQ